MKKPINDPAANEWLDLQKENTKNNYSTAWRKFSAFVKMTGSEILESRRKDQNQFWEKKVLAFKVYLEKQGLASYTTTLNAMAVRSFFAYNRLPLIFIKQEGHKLAERSRTTEDYRFSLDDLRKLSEVADLQERYVVVAGKSFGLRAGDFLRLTRGNLEPNIDSETPISIGQINTIKESVPAFPFIDSDAKPIVKLMLDSMSRQGRTDAKERILTYDHEIQLSRVLKRLAQKSGLNVGSRVVRFHCLRKFLCDHLSSHMSSEKWKLIVGKKIAESAYISADSLREDYKRAMAETCFAGIDDRARQAAREEYERLFTPEQRAWADKHMDKRFSKVKKKKAVDDETCSDGEHCQKVVTESELHKFLSQGWKASIVLPSGKIVCER